GVGVEMELAIQFLEYMFATKSSEDNCLLKHIYKITQASKRDDNAGLYLRVMHTDTEAGGHGVLPQEVPGNVQLIA
ncbi:hypothetical protein ACJX0J_024269, partial [Zea mays]